MASNGPTGRSIPPLSTETYTCKKIKHISHKPPCLSDSLLAECKLKSRIFHLLKIQPKEENSKKYRAQRNRVSALIRRAKKDFASSFDDICGRQNGSNLWSLINEKNPKKIKQSQPPWLAHSKQHARYHRQRQSQHTEQLLPLAVVNRQSHWPNLQTLSSSTSNICTPVRNSSVSCRGVLSSLLIKGKESSRNWWSAKQSAKSRLSSHLLQPRRIV